MNVERKHWSLSLLHMVLGLTASKENGNSMMLGENEAESMAYLSCFQEYFILLIACISLLKGAINLPEYLLYIIS